MEEVNDVAGTHRRRGEVVSVAYRSRRADANALMSGVGTIRPAGHGLAGRAHAGYDRAAEIRSDNERRAVRSDEGGRGNLAGPFDPDAYIRRAEPQPARAAADHLAGRVEDQSRSQLIGAVVDCQVKSPRGVEGWHRGDAGDRDRETGPNAGEADGEEL